MTPISLRVKLKLQGGAQAPQYLAPMTYLASPLSAPHSPLQPHWILCCSSKRPFMDAALCLDRSSPRDPLVHSFSSFQSLLRHHLPSEACPVHPSKTTSHSLALPTPFYTFFYQDLLPSILMTISNELIYFVYCLSAPTRL